LRGFFGSLQWQPGVPQTLNCSPRLPGLRLYQLDLLPDLFLIHADIITELSAFVNKKMSPLPK
jgi:hypothetical protein